MKFYQKSVDEVIQLLQTSLETGLSEKDIKNRIKKYGENKIPHKKATSWWVIFVRQLINPLMFVLLIAAVVSFLIGERKDSLVIMIAVIINTVLGFVQEFRAERAADSLHSYEVAYCLVRRNSKTVSVDASEVVPGDIVLFSAGMRVPADVRLTHVVDFTVDEAILTGESKPVEKSIDVMKHDCVIGDQRNMVFSGTFVVGGKAEGVVVGSGTYTELGKISDLVEKTQEAVTPLQVQLKKFSWALCVVIIGITFFLVLLGLIKGMSFHEIFMIGIALAVAAIPEGLLISMTAVLAVGMHRMLKRKALVRHLVAAETLGGVSVICCDKTGTLTEGKMRSVRLITHNHDIVIDKDLDTSIFNEDGVSQVLRACVLNSDVEVIDEETFSGLPTEIALFQLAKQANINTQKIRQEYPRVHEISFSSDLKYMVTVHTVDGMEKMIVKGAPEKIFMMCDGDIELFKKHADRLAQEGLRMIAIAVKHEKDIDRNNLTQLTCIGLIAIQDPLRPEAVSSIKELENAGLRVVLVTGDHKDTAAYVARGAGMKIRENGIVSGQEIELMSHDELYEKIDSIDVFARVEPKHKIRIVRAWQSRGHSVAMTGDGINDAPALKAADIGVSVGSGSDVAHEISDVVLLDDNLSTIGAAVREGRIIFDNIRKIIVYLVTDGFAGILLISVCLIIGLPLPVLASQIFWTNLISDGFPNLALTVAPAEPDVMDLPPRDKDAFLINTQMKVIIFIIGTIINIVILGIYFYYYFFSGLDIMHIRSIIFTALAVGSLFYVFPVASLRRPLWKVNPFENPWLIASVALGFALQLSVIYVPYLQELFSTVPLNAYDWGVILCFGIFEIIAVEIAKFFFIVKK